MTKSYNPEERRRGTAFSLLELMMVVTLILITATITQPIYQNIVIRAREAALRDTLFTMRSMIDRFTLDNQRPPASLEEMAEAGYLGDVPIDPFTHSNRTWLAETDDFPQSGERGSAESRISETLRHSSSRTNRRVQKGRTLGHLAVLTVRFSR